MSAAVEFFAKTFAHNSGVCHYVIRRGILRDPFIPSRMSTTREARRVWITGSLEQFAIVAEQVFSGEIADPGTRDRRKTFRRKYGWSAGAVHAIMPERWWDDAALERDGYRRLDI